MTLLFICRGNTWRSRVAEAYAKSLTVSSKNLTIKSSGIEAERNLNGRIKDYTKKLLMQDNIWQFASKDWTQTKQSQIDDADLIVFMSETVYLDALKKYKLKNKKVIVLQVPDRYDSYELIKHDVLNVLTSMNLISSDNA